MKELAANDKKAIDEFDEAVNMTAKTLEKWLATADSKRVGDKEDGAGESVGHESGKKIIKILSKKQAEYTVDDLQHIHKVVGYVHRHLAQKPDGDITETNWRYSLMNWGHDPAK
ncbi:MAG: DUF3140 domain-containing protein [Acidobacteriota bacterium]|nr:DUF3140 domain-containing protein [Acidobacteriota bacterium]